MDIRDAPRSGQLLEGGCSVEGVGPLSMSSGQEGVLVKSIRENCVDSILSPQSSTVGLSVLWRRRRRDAGVSPTAVKTGFFRF